MNLRLLRFTSNEFNTLGLLYLGDEFLCFTLEDAYHEQKIFGKTRIPPGLYPLKLAFAPKHSPTYGHDMIFLQNVPDYEGVMIHRGNTEVDTDGCVLVGNTVTLESNGGLMNSGDAYNRIYPIISDWIKKEDSFIYVKDE